MTKILQTLEDVRIDGDDIEGKKIRELDLELCREGYQVERCLEGEEGFDLIASKGDRRIAIKVKVNTDLAESAEAIKSLRTRAREGGYAEFRFVIVRARHEDNISIAGLEAKLPDLVESYIQNPPPEKRTEIATLKEHLFGFLSGELSPDLGVLTGRRLFGGAFGTDIKSVAIRPDGIRVVGSGAMEIKGMDEPRLEGSEFYPDVPFDFDITFSPNLDNPTINGLEFQLSGLVA